MRAQLTQPCQLAVRHLPQCPSTHLPAGTTRPGAQTTSAALVHRGQRSQVGITVHLALPLLHKPHNIQALPPAGQAGGCRQGCWEWQARLADRHRRLRLGATGAQLGCLLLPPWHVPEGGVGHDVASLLGLGLGYHVYL
jgi:hypothetical protein